MAVAARHAATFSYTCTGSVLGGSWKYTYAVRQRPHSVAIRLRLLLHSRAFLETRVRPSVRETCATSQRGTHSRAAVHGKRGLDHDLQYNLMNTTRHGLRAADPVHGGPRRGRTQAGISRRN